MTSAQAVAAGTVLDCTGLDIVVTGPSGKISVAGGAFALIANELTIDQGREIVAAEGASTKVGVALDLAGSLNLHGQLVARNAGRGSYVSVTAAGSITMDGSNPAIDVVGTANNATGGDVFLASGSFVLIDKRIDANGKPAATDSNQNSGGTVHVNAAGDIIVEEEIRAFGRWAGGGDVILWSDQNVFITYDTGIGGPRGQIVADGRSFYGDGGYVDIVGGNAIVIDGPINLAGGTNSAGGDAIGGEIYLQAGCGGIVLADQIDISGGGYGGGALVTYADGPISFTGAIDGHSRRLGGDGGFVALDSLSSVSLEAESLIDIAGHWSSNPAERGFGGALVAKACQVEFQGGPEGGASVVATGAFGGDVHLRALKTPLQGDQDYSVRVAEDTLIDATGEYVEGEILIEVSEARDGVCSNNSLISCADSADCAFGLGGHCIHANPDTGGTVAQFSPAPSMRENARLAGCDDYCACDAGYDDCDGEPINRCETSLTTLTDCGACGQACALANSTETCANQSCEITECDIGWCDLDDVDANGCELDLDVNPSCATSATSLGAVRGDAGADTLARTSRGEAWFRVTVSEADTSPLAPNDLSATITLTPPSDGNYDLKVYCDGCGTTVAGAASSPGAAIEQLIVRWPEATTCILDNCFPSTSDSGRTITIGVLHSAAETCSSWQLAVNGNTSGGVNTCGAK